MSGIGVCKNAGDFSSGCGHGTTLPQIVHRSLHFEEQDDYNASQWVPDVIIVYAGSNDMVNLFPPSGSEFLGAYRSMIKDIVTPYTAIMGYAAYSKVIHICNNATSTTHPCDWIRTVAGDTNGTYCSTFSIPAHGCVGHRNITEQTQLAKDLVPVIAAVAGW